MDISRIFEIRSDDEFRNLALEIFEYQYRNTEVYRSFCELLEIRPNQVHRIEGIPFLPIEFYKSRKVLAGDLSSEICFKSSGTTGQQVSKHFVADLNLYRKSFRKTFASFYGPIEDYCVLALLPSYLEREDSSLVHMVADLIQKSRYQESGFYLKEYEQLARILQKLDGEGVPVLLIGVTFALLEMAGKYPLSLSNTTVIETGGMKGRGKELIRDEVHQVLQRSWGLKEIHSEYGMTELLSQAYSRGSGIFYTAPWMKVLIRDPEDPMQYLRYGQT